MITSPVADKPVPLQLLKPISVFAREPRPSWRVMRWPDLDLYAGRPSRRRPETLYVMRQRRVFRPDWELFANRLPVPSHVGHIEPLDGLKLHSERHFDDRRAAKLRADCHKASGAAVRGVWWPVGPANTVHIDPSREFVQAVQAHELRRPAARDNRS